MALTAHLEAWWTLVLIGDKSIVVGGEWQREFMRIGLLFSDTQAMASVGRERWLHQEL